MEYVVLTQYGGKILGPIAKYILGPILNGIFIFLDWLPWKNSANVGVAIILFTIVIYILLLPLTIKQQKFSKLQAKMNPELEEIRKKYKNRKDQDSQMAMNQETQAVYAKYGVSPTGSCAQLLIQMPILFALYRVIYAIPAYVPMVKNVFTDLVSKLVLKDGATEVIQGFKSASMFTKQFEAIASGDTSIIENTYIDVLNRASSTEWATLSEKFSDLSGVINTTMDNLKGYNNFLGINVGYSPADTIKNAAATHSYLIIVLAILIPVLSAVTQWINVKLTPSSNNNNKNSDQPDQAAALQKSMMFMPLISAAFCFTLPAGMGIYWIAGSVVRSIQQVIINKHIDKIDLDAEIKKNVEKRNARLRKAGIDPEKLAQKATQSTKSVNYSYSYDSNKKKTLSQKAMLNGKPIDEVTSDSVDYKNKNASKPGSLASKANMVREYNERNNK
ncbi:MAG: YidC/Oxa1 family membrane protein insertase [Lachnospiraceae bacterium]|nr:YidC/Oxa1 family membrane protein insertase [Lachnospiraceae bacterium]